MPVYYLMRVKGKAKIPDYIQVRDEHFTLVGYVRPGREEKLSKVVEDADLAEKLKIHLDQLEEYGKITRVEL